MVCPVTWLLVLVVPCVVGVDPCSGAGTVAQGPESQPFGNSAQKRL